MTSRAKRTVLVIGVVILILVVIGQILAAGDRNCDSICNNFSFIYGVALFFVLLLAAVAAVIYVIWLAISRLRRR